MDAVLIHEGLLCSRQDAKNYYINDRIAMNSKYFTKVEMEEKLDGACLDLAKKFQPIFPMDVVNERENKR